MLELTPRMRRQYRIVYSSWPWTLVVKFVVAPCAFLKFSLLKFSSLSCQDPGSNRGPSDLQSDALPTELSRQMQMANARSPSCPRFAKFHAKIKISGLECFRVAPRRGRLLPLRVILRKNQVISLQSIFSNNRHIPSSPCCWHHKMMKNFVC